MIIVELALGLELVYLLFKISPLPLILFHLPQNGIFLVILWKHMWSVGHLWPRREVEVYTYLDVLLFVIIHTHLLTMFILEQPLPTGHRLVGIDDEGAFAVLHLDLVKRRWRRDRLNQRGCHGRQMRLCWRWNAQAYLHLMYGWQQTTSRLQLLVSCYCHGDRDTAAGDSGDGLLMVSTLR